MVDKETVINLLQVVVVVCLSVRVINLMQIFSEQEASAATHAHKQRAGTRARTETGHLLLYHTHTFQFNLSESTVRYDGDFHNLIEEFSFNGSCRFCVFACKLNIAQHFEQRTVVLKNVAFFYSCRR